jgi:uncharacterized membrane protein (GlpM family)
LRYLLSFLLGGALISAIAYLGHVGRTLLASFVAMVPVLTLLSFALVYVEAGPLATREFARGLLVFLPGWIAYVVFMWLAVMRLGIWGALAGGLGLFLAINLAMLGLGSP